MRWSFVHTNRMAFQEIQLFYIQVHKVLQIRYLFTFKKVCSALRASINGGRAMKKES